MFRRAPGRVPVRCRALDTPTKALVGLCCQGRAGRGVLPPRVTDSIKRCPQDTPTLNAAMKYYTSTTEYNCRIDLHARQMYICVMDRQGKNWSTPMSKTMTSIIS